VAPLVDLKKINLLGVQHLINDMPLTVSDVVLINPGAGYLANLQSGLVNTASGSATVTGDGSTNFTTSLVVGDTVVIGGNVEIVVRRITNSTQFIATSNAVGDAHGKRLLHLRRSERQQDGADHRGRQRQRRSRIRSIGRDGKVTGRHLPTARATPGRRRSPSPRRRHRRATRWRRRRRFGYNSELGARAATA
jgi:hypothetical protein